MNTTLAVRCAKLRSRLDILDQTASNVAEVKALEVLRIEIASRSEKLQIALEKQRLLASSSVEVPTPASLTTVHKRARGILEKFLAETKAATLKRGRGWRALLDEVDSAARDVSAAVTSAWRAHRQAVFSGETPKQILGKLARTESNNDAFNDYERLYNQLKVAFDNVPEDVTAITYVGQVALDLEKVSANFDFDVPPEVKLFLEAVSSVNGAPLSLLTSTVQAWLKENTSPESYRIRATGYE